MMIILLIWITITLYFRSWYTIAYATNCNVLWHSVLCINWHRSFLLYNHNTRAFCSHLDRYKTITEIKEKIIYKFSARYTVSERSSWGRFTNNKRHEALLKCCLWTTHTSAWHWPVWITNKFHALRSRLTESRIFKTGADLEVCF